MSDRGAARIETAWFPGRERTRVPIVLLHEGLGSVAAWRDFPQQLAAATAADVFAYSRVGYGRSAPLEGARVPSFMHDEAAVLRDLLDAEGIERPVLFGHSDGGTIALLAAATGVVLSGLIVAAPHVMVEDVSIHAIEAARERYERGDLRARLARYHDDVDGAFRGWNDVWLDPRFREWSIVAELPAIRVPVLAFQGLDDPYGSAAHVHAIARAVPATEVVLMPGCGHSPHRERTDEVLARTAAFVRDFPPRRG